jgi:hypothetical protein
MSGDWQRLHRVRRVCSGSPENHWVTRLSHKTEAEDSTRRCGHPGRFNRPGGAVRLPGAGQIARAGLTAQEGRSDRPGRRPRCFEAEDTRRGRKACVEAKQVAVAGHPSDEKNLKTSEFTLEGLVSLVLSKGSLVFWVPPYVLIEWVDGSQLLEP